MRTIIMYDDVYKKLERWITMSKNRGLALDKGWLHCVSTTRCNSIPGGRKTVYSLECINDEWQK